MAVAMSFHPSVGADEVAVVSTRRCHDRKRAGPFFCLLSLGWGPGISFGSASWVRAEVLQFSFSVAGFG